MLLPVYFAGLVAAGVVVFAGGLILFGTLWLLVYAALGVPFTIYLAIDGADLILWLPLAGLHVALYTFFALGGGRFFGD